MLTGFPDVIADGFDIVVNDCYAHNGAQKKIQLIDQYGWANINKYNNDWHYLSQYKCNNNNKLVVLWPRMPRCLRRPAVVKSIRSGTLPPDFLFIRFILWVMRLINE